TLVNVFGRGAVCYHFIGYYALTHMTVNKHVGRIPVLRVVTYSTFVIWLAWTLAEVAYTNYLGPNWFGILDQAALRKNVLIIDGFVTGTAMALLFGRLNSTVFEFPPWVMPALMSYALIQPLQSEMEGHPRLEAAAFSAALYLKTLLWLCVCYAMQSGR